MLFVQHRCRRRKSRLSSISLYDFEHKKSSRLLQQQALVLLCCFILLFPFVSLSTAFTLLNNNPIRNNYINKCNQDRFFTSCYATTTTTIQQQKSSGNTRSSTNTITTTLRQDDENEKIPFIIERVPNQPNQKLFQEISMMCITAFFNDDDNNNNRSTKQRQSQTTNILQNFWKGYNLGLLQRMQMEDLYCRRRNSSTTKNIMFVAYRVVPVLSLQSSSSYNKKQKPLLLDLTNVQNRSVLYKQTKQAIQNIQQQQQKKNGKSTMIHNTNNNSINNRNKKNSNTAVLLDRLIRMNNMNNKNMYNTDNTYDYVRGEVLGFVEVTQRPYAFADDYESSSSSSSSSSATTTIASSTIAERRDRQTIGTRQQISSYQEREQQKRQRNKEEMEDTTNTVTTKGNYSKKKTTGTTTTLRPVLTNLSVQNYARQSGVGTCLLKQCEHAVVHEWDMKEIILEVEHDNTKAIQFYKKRCYNILYEDPTCRRYNVNSIFLQQVRCKRYILQKKLVLLQQQQSVLQKNQSSTNPPIATVKASITKSIDFVKRFFQ